VGCIVGIQAGAKLPGPAPARLWNLIFSEEMHSPQKQVIGLVEFGIVHLRPAYQLLFSAKQLHQRGFADEELTL